MQDLLTNWFPNVMDKTDKFWGSLSDTLLMTLWSGGLAFLIGGILGVLVVITRKGGILENAVVFRILDVVINFFRSIPFIILIVLLLPVTQVLVGAITGAKAAIPSLVFSAAPFYARLVEIAFHEVDGGVLEAAESMGATKWQLVFKVLIPESLPALVSGITVTAISLIGYTAMAGAIGAGGLGQLAYTDGFQSYNNAITLTATVVIVIIVFAFQYLGDFAVKRIDKR